MVKLLVVLVSLFLAFPPYPMARAGQDLPQGSSSSLNQVDPEFNDLVPKPDKPGFREFVHDTALAYIMWWAGRLFYVRNKNDRIFNTSFSDWMDHITDLPEVKDGDSFVTNYVYHPLFGAAYYLFYRGMEHGIIASAIGSVVMSTLWEYTVEGLVERASLPDLLSTPGLGVPLGIMLENISSWFEERDGSASRFMAYLTNPTKMFIKNRQIGVLNPLTGSFAFGGPFVIEPNKAEVLGMGYPFFLEPPLSLGRIKGEFEVASLKGDPGGEFIFYSLRFDFPSSDNRYGIYIEIPYAGVNNVDFGGKRIDDGFEFGNIMWGGKGLFFESAGAKLGGGLEMVTPTAFKDNKDRLKAVLQFRRDFPLYLRKALTLTPYISGVMEKGNISLQSNLGFDLVFNAKELESDALESRVKYGMVAGVDLPVPTDPKVFVEFNGYTFISSKDNGRTDLFITPGFRFGKKYSPGFGLQIPITGASSLIAASFLFDFQARF